MLFLLSPAFGEGEWIPAIHTADGEDISPPLVWKGNFDAGSFALICTDPDAPSGEWIHWVAYDIPPDARALAEAIPRVPALPDGTLQGTNDWGDTGYGGPAPPSGTHRYVFTLFALDGPVDLGPGASAEQLLEAMEGRILATARLTGIYARGWIGG